MSSKVEIGSVISGTARPEDLIPIFEELLSKILEYTPKDGWRSYYRYPETDEEYINDLIETLEEQAPPYTFFGTHEGNWSDYGFWPDTDRIAGQGSGSTDILMVGPDGTVQNNLVLRPGDGLPHILRTNDHGNMTLSTFDGEEIWSIV